MADAVLKNENIDYSIVVPVYCNEGSLEDLYIKIQSDVVQQNGSKSYEIIFIDDGSHDASLEKILDLKKQNPTHIKIIKFSRNFGQVPAILAGYEHAKGNCIINISADLQDPPRLINQMLNSFYDENFDIVISYRKSRDESLFRKFTSQIFYWMMKKLSFPDMPAGGFDFILISKRVKNCILISNESNPFLQGKVLWPGFKKKFIPYDREKRISGKSKWSLSKKIKYLIDGIMGYSYLPLRLMTLIGIIISFLGFAYALIITFLKIFGDIPIQGWAPIMIIILILSGIQMLMLGIIGEYLWRALDQVRNRPQYIIDKIFD
ncbi:MAG: glycosyltransferase [Desulfobacteraceae bacterium]|nr:glycosyltransferase [Desulfobacteraceae bacterium]MBC2756735.1 glycosyltransferase [Desulfobacteraceae bacterium]